MIYLVREEEEDNGLEKILKKRFKCIKVRERKGFFAYCYYFVGEKMEILETSEILIAVKILNQL